MLHLLLSYQCRRMHGLLPLRVAAANPACCALHTSTSSSCRSIIPSLRSRKQVSCAVCECMDYIRVAHSMLRASLHRCVLHLPHPVGAAHLRGHVLTRSHRLFLPRRADCLQAGGYFNCGAVLSPLTMACPAAAASATSSCTGATGVAVNIEVRLA